LLIKGNDDVAVCKVFQNQPIIEHMYVSKGSRRPYALDKSDLTIGYSNIKVNYQNGIRECSFTRINKMPEVPNYFDLSSPYHLLFAHGLINSSSKNFNLKFKIKN
jgi:hypothetical protein